jgi:hypothetical protein
MISQNREKIGKEANSATKKKPQAHDGTTIEAHAHSKIPQKCGITSNARVACGTT